MNPPRWCEQKSTEIHDYWGDFFVQIEFKSKVGSNLLCDAVEVQRKRLGRCKHEHTEQAGDSNQRRRSGVCEQVAILEVDIPENDNLLCIYRITSVINCESIILIAKKLS